MGLLKTIGGFLFGGSDTANKSLEMADKAMSGIGTWIDERKFTEEEQVKASAQSVAAYLEWFKIAASENGPRSVTRRVLAWGISGFIVFWASVGMGFAIAEPWYPKAGEAVANMIAVAEAYKLGWAFAGVIVFYFGVQIFRAKSSS